MLISAAILSTACATFEARRARLSPNVAPLTIMIAPLITASNSTASTTVEIIISRIVKPARERFRVRISAAPVEVQGSDHRADLDRLQQVRDRRDEVRVVRAVARRR